jgi:TPR repeat protein
MSHQEPKAPPPGRSSARWFLFLSFYHLLPVPWYMAVVAGLAPASFLFAGGIASLYISDNDSLAFAAFLLAPAIISGLIFYAVAWVLSNLIGKIRTPVIRSVSLLILLSVSLIAAMNPLFISGGHGQSSAFSLFEFINILEEFRIPRSASIAYFCTLAILLMVLLGYQQLVANRDPIPVLKWQQHKRIRRKLVVAGLIILLLSLGWTHRILLVVKPLADMGVASAQYHLAMVIMEQSGSRGSYQDYLVKSAEQGHIKAALQLVLHPRSREEELRWLTVAAEGEMAGAQFELYRELIKPSPVIESSASAREWLEKAADNDHPEAQYELGRYHLSGNDGLGIAKNLAKVQYWWEQSSDHGYGRASEEMAWRYEKGANGFPRDPQRAVELYNLVADGYEQGLNGLRQNDQMSSFRRGKAKSITQREERLVQGDPQALAALAHELLGVAEPAPETIMEGITLLESAASQGDPQLQYELGDIFLSGRHEQAIDLPRGQNWWAKALEQNHVKTMETVAPAYQNGRFGYPVDLLKSKALVSKLVAAYSDGLYGVDPDLAKARRWASELKYFTRLFELSGGNYQSPDELRARAETGDVEAQYQLARQMMATGPVAQRQQGQQWLERAAESGYAEAQYRLVASKKTLTARDVAILEAAAAQNHLPAMGRLALGYEKGRYGLKRDYSMAKDWYQRILEVYEAGDYLGEINKRFIPFNRQRLVYATKAMNIEIEKARRYEAATPLGRKIIKVEERYSIAYQKAVNALKRNVGGKAGKEKFRAEAAQLREEYYQRRDAEIARIKQEN